MSTTLLWIVWAFYAVFLGLVFFGLMAASYFIFPKLSEFFDKKSKDGFLGTLIIIIVFGMMGFFLGSIFNMPPFNSFNLP